MSGVLNAAANVAGAVGSIAGAVSGVLGGGGFGDVGPLQDGSWRGNYLAVRVDRQQVGRRIALHEYPFRDDVWPEDLGMRANLFSVECFIIGEDPAAWDVLDQRDPMVAALTQPGVGVLVLPAWGPITAVLMDASVSVLWDYGNVVQLQLNFVRVPASNLSQYPASTLPSQDSLANAGAAVQAASSGDFVSDVGDAVTTGLSVVSQAVDTVGAFAGAVTGAVQDAGLVASSVLGLGDAFYGRYSMGGYSSFQPAGSTAAGLIAGGVVAAGAVVSAAGAAVSAAAALPA